MRWLVVGTLLVAASAGATQYRVGPTQTYTSPCALFAAMTLQPGDVVLVDYATYTDACQVTSSGAAGNPITLQGVPNASGQFPLFNPDAGLDLSGAGSVPRAIFQFTGGSYWVATQLELENAMSPTSGNAAAFRATAGSHDILIDNVSIHGNQDGVMSDGVATVTIMNSDIYGNGIGDGYTHNLYMQGDTTVLIGNHIHDSNGGQNVKLRSPYAVLLYNLIERAGNYEIDLIQNPPQTDAPNSNAVLIGNVIVRPASAGNNSQVILFGTDNAGENARNGALYAVNNTIVMANGSNRLFHAIGNDGGNPIVIDNNIITATAAGTGMATDATTAAILQGQNNWINTNVTQAGTLTATVTGADPMFASATDYHLTAGSTARAVGFLSPTFMDHMGNPQSAVPNGEFNASPIGTVPRPVHCTLDIGAYEFDTGTSGCDGGGVGTDGGGGSKDGGSSADAGSGPGADSGNGGTDGGGGTAKSGCSCGTADAAPWMVLGALAMAGLLGRRRVTRGRA